MMHSSAGWVREFGTGVMAGRGTGTLFFAVAIHSAVVAFDAAVKQGEEGNTFAGARAYADDVHSTGEASNLLECVPLVTEEMSKLGLQMYPQKFKLLLGKERPADDPIFQTAEQMGVEVLRDGIKSMGVPIGTDEYIEQTVEEMVGKYADDLQAIKYFTRQTQWAMILYCISQRPLFLLRTVKKTLGVQTFARFEKALTEKVMEVLQHEN